MLENLQLKTNIQKGQTSKSEYRFRVLSQSKVHINNKKKKKKFCYYYYYSFSSNNLYTILNISDNTEI